MDDSTTHRSFWSQLSNSDRLAVALACLAGAMAIVLFLVDRTPTSVILLLGLMLALLIFPIFHFFRGELARLILMALAIIGTVVFGWRVWPKTHPIAAQSNQPQSSIPQIPIQSPPTDKPVRKRVPESKLPPKQAASDERQDTIHIDDKVERKKTLASIETKVTRAPENQASTLITAPNGIVIAGGTVNNPTVNNYGPPPVNLRAQSKDVQSSDNAFAFEKQVSISVDQPYSPVSLGFLCDVDVEKVTAYGVQYNGRSGTDTHNKKLAFVYFDGPPIVPNNPLVVSLWSSKYLNVVRVAPAQFSH